jgi:hypothetical protein
VGEITASDIVMHNAIRLAGYEDTFFLLIVVEKKEIKKSKLNL